MKFTVTGEMKEVNKGLVDYIAKGTVEIEGETVKCDIGFTEFSEGIEATHIFIKDHYEGDTHYFAETIEL